jgi:hypothetical protein
MHIQCHTEEGSPILTPQASLFSGEGKPSHHKVCELSCLLRSSLSLRMSTLYSFTGRIIIIQTPAVDTEYLVQSQPSIDLCNTDGVLAARHCSKGPDLGPLKAVATASDAVTFFDQLFCCSSSFVPMLLSYQPDQLWSHSPHSPPLGNSSSGINSGLHQRSRCFISGQISLYGVVLAKGLRSPCFFHSTSK